jgi:hypothetical protein
MRTFLPTILAVFGLSLGAFAQGTVAWEGAGPFFVAETNSTQISSFMGFSGNPSGTVGVTTGNTAANNAALGYQGYYYELLVSSTASSAPTTVFGLSAWSDTGLTATNGAFSNGRIIQYPGSAAAIANNWPVNTTENVILVGWSANLGNTWGAVLNQLENLENFDNTPAYFGVSSMGTAESIPSPGPGNTLFGTNTFQINNGASNPMQLDVIIFIPEPGTLALAALGGASLLLLRRRK